MFKYNHKSGKSFLNFQSSTHQFKRFIRVYGKGEVSETFIHSWVSPKDYKGYREGIPHIHPIP